ncbi:fibroblast growth factor 18-like, partial [Lethenteron reissneri]|uniref:fibroblast growth factor 18-like n=1 Tax=Lethenteron reissneri TaxID=7753 RepID=UPI002AB79E58
MAATEEEGDLTSLQVAHGIQAHLNHEDWPAVDERTVACNGGPGGGCPANPFERRVAISFPCGATAIVSAERVPFLQLAGSPPSSWVFDRHVQEASRRSDDLSRRVVRTYQLYSRASGAHVQVLGPQIVARGGDGDPYALLRAETDSFGGNIRLLGVRTRYHICMDRNGNLVGKLDGRDRGCVFTELYLENHYTALRSAEHPQRFAAFDRRGRATRAASAITSAM